MLFSDHFFIMLSNKKGMDDEHCVLVNAFYSKTQQCFEYQVKVIVVRPPDEV